MYLLTRPLEKAQPSAEAFSKAGINVNVIASVSTPPTSDAQQQLAQLAKSRVDFVILTSTQAAKIFVNTLSPHTFNVPLIAIGESTLGLLKNAGFDAVCPPAHTSESLLSLDQFKLVSNKLIAIVKGHGGRTLINDALSSRGAIISQYNVYERKVLTPPVTTCSIDKRAINGIIATSAELAELLIEQYPWLRECPIPWVTVSERIAKFLNKIGMTNVSVSTGASDKALIKWVQEFWE